jgi:putative transposase
VDEAMTTTPTFTELEKEIKIAFSRLRKDQLTCSHLLSKMPLKTLEDYLITISKVWWGDQRLKYHPMAVMKAILFMELRGITSYEKLVLYLYENSREVKRLGFEKRFVPTSATFSRVNITQIDETVRKILDFIVDKIMETSREENKLLDISYPGVTGACTTKSDRTVKRHKVKEGSKTIRFLRKEIFPTLSLPLSCKARYGKDNFLDLLAYIAQHHMCANLGSDMLKEEDGKSEEVPHSRTLLGHLAKLDDDEIKDMFIAAFTRIIKIGKSRGLLDRPVDLSLDYTDTLYYGDKNSSMVIGGKFERGTCNRFRYIVLKVSERYGDFTMLALPIGIFTDRVEAAKTLIQFALKWVKPRYVYVDRGFFDKKFIDLFESMGLKYLMPAPRTSRVKRLLDKHKPPVAIDFPMTTAKGKTIIPKLVIVKADDGHVVVFTTNLPPLMLYTGDLFKLYAKRWSIETSFRVQKYEFRPKTTSKNWKVRLYYFLFSCLLYNLWIITNAFLSKYLFGEFVEYRIMRCKMFMKLFYKAYEGRET